MIELLEELKQLDYELYCRTGGYSHLDEEQWDWLIEQFKIHEKKGKFE